MAPQKTKYPKKPRDVHIEDALFDFGIQQTRGSGDCFHDKKGSFSEHCRRGYKSWLLLKFPNIKSNSNMKDVDWSEAY
jgi:hypothetical protein